MKRTFVVLLLEGACKVEHRFYVCFRRVVRRTIPVFLFASLLILLPPALLTDSLSSLTMKRTSIGSWSWSTSSSTCSCHITFRRLRLSIKKTFAKLFRMWRPTVMQPVKSVARSSVITRGWTVTDSKRQKRSKRYRQNEAQCEFTCDKLTLRSRMILSSICSTLTIKSVLGYSLMLKTTTLTAGPFSTKILSAILVKRTSTTAILSPSKPSVSFRWYSDVFHDKDSFHLLPINWMAGENQTSKPNL